MALDRFVLNPHASYWNPQSHAADVLPNDRTNLPYHEAVSRILVGMSLPERLVAGTTKTSLSKQPTSVFENTKIIKVLDLPGINQTIPDSRLIAPLDHSDYVVAGSVTHPFCLTITPTSSEVRDIYPEFPYPLSHIAVASPIARTIFVADMKKDLYLSHPGCLPQKIMRSPDGFTDITPINPTGLDVTAHNQVCFLDIRGPRTLTEICRSVNERFLRTFAKNNSVFVVSDQGVKNFDVRHSHIPICAVSLPGITAAAQKASSLFIGTETDKPCLAEYNLNLACTSLKSLERPIKDILCPPLDKGIITLQDRSLITIWDPGHALRPIEISLPEFQQIAHGAISCDGTSLAIVSREKECVGFLNLTPQKETPAMAL